MATEPSAIEVRERELFSGSIQFSEDASPSLVALKPSFGLPQKLAIPERAAAFIRVVRMAAVLEHERGVAALLAPLAMGGGALAYFNARSEPSLIGLAGCLVLLGLLARVLRGAVILRFVVMSGALAMAGATFAKLEVLRANTRVLGSEISTRLTGYVVQMDHLANGRVRLLIDVARTERPTLRYQPDRVRVSAGRLPPGILAGSLITGPVRLLPPSGPVRPGGYDYAFESYFRGVGANGYFLGLPQLSPDAPEHSIIRRFSAFLENARSSIAAHIQNTIAGPEGEIAAALIVGVRAGIPEQVNESLRRTGLAHILSISGLHMALVAAIVMGAVRFGFALFPASASLHPAKKYAAFSALFVVAAYLLISGGEIAAQRSFVMLAVMLLAVLMDRSALSMRNLAIAAAVVLVIAPHEIMGPSFQMSFAATAALIGAYSLWGAARQTRQHRGMRDSQTSLLRRSAKGLASLIGGTIVTALVAGIATAIFGAWHFQRVSPLSLFANLAVTPIVSLAVMPSAVLAALTMPLSMDGPFLTVMGKGLSALLSISDWLSERSPADATGLIPVRAVIWLTIALLAAAVPTTRLRWAAIPAAIAGLLSLLSPPKPQVLVSENAELVAVDGGEGRMLLDRPRKNNFTLTGWKRAFGAEQQIKPASLSKSASVAPKKSASELPAPQAKAGAASLEQLLAHVSPREFLCDQGLCLAEHETGSIVAVSDTAGFPRLLCAVATLIIVREPGFPTRCGPHAATVLSATTLARYGAAEVRFIEGSGSSPSVSITHAIEAPYRPWHSYRAFSRTARGLGLPPSRKPIPSRRQPLSRAIEDKQGEADEP